MDSSQPPTWFGHLDRYASWYMAGLAVLFAVGGALTVPFYPSYSWPGGDEGTYLDYARQPWTLTSEFFEGFRPKVVQNPYNARLFLNPFSLVFSVFGFTYVGARMVCVAYGLAILWLVYRLTGRLAKDCPAPRAAGLVAAAVLALQPQLFYFTHGIRPEILFTLGLLLNTWILVRSAAPSARTWLALGLCSSCMLFVHYNGVTAPVLFFGAALFHDRKSLSWRKVLAFIAGGVIFLVIFFAVNFLPAIETVKEYGLLPVTFVSSNEIPIAKSFNIFAPVESAFRYYVGYWSGEFDAEPQTMWFSTALVVPAALGLRRGSWPTAATLFVTCGLLGLIMIFLIPNRRWEYGFYLCPWVFIFAGAALNHPRRWSRWVGLVALLAAAIAFGWADARDLSLFAGYRKGNLATEAAIRRVVEELGGDEKVTVMATQEFRIAVPEVRYRTFHSVLSTRSLEKSLDWIRPNVVVVHGRTVQWLAFFSQAYDRIPEDLRMGAVFKIVQNTLAARGFRRVAVNERLTWDEAPVLLFVKP